MFEWCPQTPKHVAGYNDEDSSGIHKRDRNIEERKLEIVQCLRTFIALAEDLGSIPNMHMVVRNYL